MCKNKQNSEVLYIQDVRKRSMGLGEAVLRNSHMRYLNFYTFDSPNQQVLLRYVSDILLYNFVMNVLIIF